MIHFIYHFIVDMKLIRNSEGGPFFYPVPFRCGIYQGEERNLRRNTILLLNKKMLEPGILGESKSGAVVRALAFHQCGPGSIPGFYAICGLSLLVLYSAPRGFSQGTPVFPSPQKPTFDLICSDFG